MYASLIKVGTVARKTGLTVRTLHYYEEIGLLAPAKRSEKGYRLYGIDKMQRLQKILSLQQLGFPLDEIRTLLDRADYSLQCVLDLHMTRLKEQIQSQQRLLARLKTISQHLHDESDISIETIIQAIQITKMHESYYSPAQLDLLKQREQAMGQAGMQEARLQWRELNRAFRSEMENGTNPADDNVQALVAQMQQLIRMFTGGDPDIERSLEKMYRDEGPEAASGGAIDSDLFEYIGTARAIFEA